MTTEPGPEDCAIGVAGTVEAGPPGLNAGGGGELHAAKPTQIRPAQTRPADLVARVVVHAVAAVRAAVVGAVAVRAVVILAVRGR